MEQRKDRNSHGFTWGMLVGGAVVLMLTTKKGREILKEISDGGLEGIEEFIDIEKVKELTNEFSDDGDEQEDASPSGADQPQAEKPKKRRLFRRVRK